MNILFAITFSFLCGSSSHIWVISCGNVTQCPFNAKMPLERSSSNEEPNKLLEIRLCKIFIINFFWWSVKYSWCEYFDEVKKKSSTYSDIEYFADILTNKMSHLTVHMLSFLRRNTKSEYFALVIVDILSFYLYSFLRKIFIIWIYCLQLLSLFYVAAHCTFR